MAFEDRRLAKKVASARCEWCSWEAGRRFAFRIIDEGPEKEWNAISLCPNCATVFGEVIRPILYRALTAYGVLKGYPPYLPLSWEKDNKISKP